VKDPVDLILDTPSLSEADRIAILGGAAAKLLCLGSQVGVHNRERFRPAG
jgi:hypothetical protein